MLPGASMQSPTTGIRGVGPARAAALSALGVENTGQVLLHAPLRYEDWRPVFPMRAAVRRDVAAVAGRLESLEVRRRRPPATIMTIRCGQESALGVVYGRRGFEHRLRRGDELILHGAWTEDGDGQISSSSVQPGFRGEVRPIYPASAKIRSSTIARFMDDALQRLPDEGWTFPGQVARTLGHRDLRQLLHAIHRPKRPEQGEAARRALGYLEMLVFQLALRSLRQGSLPGFAHQGGNSAFTRRYLRSLPFSLSCGQETAIDAIGRDMVAKSAMYRLLQGDVATGKTVVAIWATLRAVESGGRAIWLVPTRILADQHVNTLSESLAPLGVDVARYAAGDSPTEAPVVVGTQALIGSEVGEGTLVVIDEQQRFGVSQREFIERANPRPDILLMSATPIPRTLARSLWGDLSVSTLARWPQAPRRVTTRVKDPSKRDDVYTHAMRQAAHGVGVFVVCPVICGGSADGVASASHWTRLLGERFPEISVDSVHGQVETDERSKRLRRFAAGDIQVLVCTNVIQVGVDIPRARMMIVESAERFGLTELHQLRGRIGRDGRRALFVALPSQAQYLDTLRPLESTDDGMQIARMDLKRRGMGDFFSRDQHGKPPFRQPEFATRLPTMVDSARVARSILSRDPALSRAEHALLRGLVSASYGDHNPWVHVL